MADNFNKLVRLRLRGGTVNEWSSSSDVKLLEGEFAYQVNNENTEYPITLHKGDGTKTWEQLVSVDSTNNMDPFTFFSGRGAGLFKASQLQMDVTGGLVSEEVFGKVTIREDERNIKLRNGYLSLADEKGYSHLRVTEITTTTIHTENISGNYTIDGDHVLLREQADTGLNLGYGGLIVARYDESAMKDTALLVDADGVWQLATRQRTTVNSTDIDPETGEEIEISTENIGAWEDFIPISTINVETDYSGPVQYDGNQLSSWIPATLAITINNGMSGLVEYNPTSDVATEFNINTLNKITITPRSYEDGEELIEQDYTVDENGELKIELPIPTNESINTWNAKVGGITLGNISLEVDENHNVTIPVDESLINGRKLTPPIKEIIYDGNTLTIENGTVSIEAVRPTINGDTNYIIVEETPTDNFTISHYKPEIESSSSISTDFLTGDHRLPKDEGYKIKVVSSIKYDDAGHITKIETATYDLATLRSLLGLSN